MKRALVIGCPGSGKSTFARRLRDATGLPLYYLDRLYWREDRTHVEREEFDARLEEILSRDQWIIDGNYARTLPMRLARCDAVFFLDYPAEVCLDGIIARRGARREDMPWVETGEDAEFIEFVRRFSADVRSAILERLRGVKGVDIYHFSQRRDAEKYLNS